MPETTAPARPFQGGMGAKSPKRRLRRMKRGELCEEIRSNANVCEQGDYISDGYRNPPMPLVTFGARK